MTILTEKFTAFETQIAEEHIEIMAALNGIAIALGAPPVTPTVSLADLNGNLIAINNNLVAMRTANATFHASLLSVAGLINTNTDTLINNNSLNAQRMIAAIYATFCACETGAPLTPLPLDVTPTPLVDDAKCRRIQFYLSLFSTWLQSIASYGSTGAAVTGDVIQGLLVTAGVAAGMTATGAEIGAAGGVPGAVIGAVVGAIVGAAYAFGGTYLVEQAIIFSSAPVQAALLAALYAANSADEGQAAFEATVGANFDFIPASVIDFLWYSAWSNDMYSESPVVDDSAFDGTICGSGEEVTWPPVTGCISFDSVTTHLSNGQTLQCIVWPDGTNVSPAAISGAAEDLSADQNIFGHADLINLWVSSSPGCHCYYNANGTPNFGIVGAAAQLTTTGNYYTMLTADTPFTVTLCINPPE